MSTNRRSSTEISNLRTSSSAMYLYFNKGNCKNKRFRVGSPFRQRHEENYFGFAPLLLPIDSPGNILRLKNRYLVNWNDDLRVPSRKDPLQNLFLARSQQNSKHHFMQVSDEINFPEYVDVSEEAKDFILRIMKKKPEERMEMREILRHPFITKYAKSRKIANEVL